MQKNRSAFTRTLVKGASIAAATAGLAVLGLNPALAHDELVSTNPAQNEQLTEAPQKITMKFSGDITNVAGANQVQVKDSSGKDVTRGEAKIDGTTVTQPITGNGSQDETYTVTWRVVSSDGHPIQGDFPVVVGQGKGESTPVSTDEPHDHDHSHEANAAGHDQDSQKSEAQAQNNDQQQGGENTGLKLGLFGLASLAVIASVVAVLLKKRPKNYD
ncbi:copper resistance CopC family protein [Rothia sp. LK2588]|uniref:copper resistance protein CopC n=1 Tax=Rothia sp. LK2588 TaxID=3114369 RepID=UPI0034CEC3B5